MNDVEKFLQSSSHGFRMLAHMKRQEPARTMHELVFVLGRPADSRNRIDVPRARNLRMCYSNAWELRRTSALALTYCEGYAYQAGGIIPVLHGYNLDGEGRVVDPSWGDKGDVQYFGIAFDDDFGQAGLGLAEPEAAHRHPAQLGVHAR